MMHFKVFTRRGRQYTDAKSHAIDAALRAVGKSRDTYVAGAENSVSCYIL